METIEKLLRGGMNVARFNFSHGTHAYHQETLDNLRAAVRNTGILCAVMLDTKGNEQMISMSYKKLAEDLKPQSTILCSDGTISSRSWGTQKALGLVRCRCENTAVLGECKNANLPESLLISPTLTDKDRIDILEWGVQQGRHYRVVVWVANLDEIIANSDAFMVARGDLGMEIPIEKIFLAQKVMIKKCNMRGSQTATQMLESMIKSPRPTRAEATDVANAVIDGARLRHLRVAKRPGYLCLAVETMAKICIERRIHWITAKFSEKSGSVVSQASSSDEEILELALKQAKAKGLCKLGDSIVMVQHCGNSAITILTVN
ncbi:hypothetical protein DH2020_003194 [Rehmannia glutinosa]|uniref:pyruvate kinase n=1 Tax=Rehmannia glutinosa TaxID=99300 RepID=A0ABR0XKW3_REHGL